VAELLLPTYSVTKHVARPPGSRERIHDFPGKWLKIFDSRSDYFSSAASFVYEGLLRGRWILTSPGTYSDRISLIKTAEISLLELSDEVSPADLWILPAGYENDTSHIDRFKPTSEVFQRLV
jgi:hypothetical protein